MDGFWMAFSGIDCSFCFVLFLCNVLRRSQNSCSLFPQLYCRKPEACLMLQFPFVTQAFSFFNFVRFVVELRHRQASSHCRSSFFLNRQRLLFLWLMSNSNLVLCTFPFSILTLLSLAYLKIWSRNSCVETWHDCSPYGYRVNFLCTRVPVLVRCR